MKNRISALILIAGLAGCAAKSKAPEVVAPAKTVAKKNILKKAISKPLPKTDQPKVLKANPVSTI